MPDELTFKDEAAAEYDRAAPGPRSAASECSDRTQWRSRCRILVRMSAPARREPHKPHRPSER